MFKSECLLAKIKSLVRFISEMSTDKEKFDVCSGRISKFSPRKLLKIVFKSSLTFESEAEIRLMLNLAHVQ